MREDGIAMPPHAGLHDTHCRTDLLISEDAFEAVARFREQPLRGGLKRMVVEDNPPP
jgi:hypothetical protein